MKSDYFLNEDGVVDDGGSPTKRYYCERSRNDDSDEWSEDSTEENFPIHVLRKVAHSVKTRISETLLQQKHDVSESSDPVDYRVSYEALLPHEFKLHGEIDADSNDGCEGNMSVIGSRNRYPGKTRAEWREERKSAMRRRLQRAEGRNTMSTSVEMSTTPDPKRYNLRHQGRLVYSLDDNPFPDQMAVSGDTPILVQAVAIHGASKDDSKHSATSQEESQKGSKAGLIGVLVDQWCLSLLLLFIPLGIVSHWLQWGDVMTFSLNFLAILPQAWLIGKGTEDLAAYAGQITGGLLNAWFGNVVEMLLCIAGLHQGELVVVRSTLVGSILSNLLLVTGCSFLFGGIRHKVQEFSAIGASTNASLMMLACLCLGLPTMYAAILPSPLESELKISRAVSFFLVLIYFQYMIFQLATHSFLFEDEEDSDDAQLSVFECCCILGICTVLCTFNSEYLVHSIQGVVTSLDLSKEFVGIILLPIIGNAAEHYTSVFVAMRNKMDLSLACAIGSSCQMALFVTPLSVLTGWCFGQPMTLDLHAFEVLVLLLSVLIVTSILQDGYSNWLEGSMLCSAYFVVALIYFFEEPKFSEII